MQNPKLKPLFLLLFSCLVFQTAIGQDKTPTLSFFEKADTFHPRRFYTIAGIGTVIYGSASIGLWNEWYKNYPIGKFHFFNDWEEWKQVDKAGHFFTSYIYANYCFEGALWTGMNRKKAMWTGALVGTGLQLTVEVMDGFSEKWGFSMGDLAFNTAGTLLFMGQELAWQEQRIKMKVSSHAVDYGAFPTLTSQDATQTMSISERVQNLYGTSFAELLLKDYNAQTNWASFNIWSFLPEREKSSFPKWLNLAVGYGGGNLFGGFGNQWTTDDGATFVLSSTDYPRYRRYMLSLDIDLSQIKTRKKWLNTLFKTLNWIKIPSPTLEFNSKGEIRGYPIYW
ncbi:MAG: DUF2279 domain-containing protein [Saprospiraceae bacterium]|nr:DUF2279 domain-containing protein [Saprospiraceae bacterium]